jgi:putative nucleotidyltransferase-like protein
MAQIPLSDVSWERMIRAVEKVKERLARAARVLDEAGIPYAVVGGNAVAAWVSRVDEAAVRNTQDVDFLLRRSDLERAAAALAKAGFVYRHVSGIDLFLDGPEAKARDAVHIVFAGEKVQPEYALPAPDVSESERPGEFLIPNLEALVRMKLTSYRLKDRVHVLDMLDVGLIDGTWCRRLPAELAERLQNLIDNPNG